jgi:hypothetical protein
MRPLVLIGMCACNSILGLGDVRDRHVDAKLFDAPPPTCPTDPGAAPTFGEAIHQVQVVSGCANYSIAVDGSAMATCTAGGGVPQIFTARPHGQLALATVNVPNISQLEIARLAGDGDFAIAALYDNGGYTLHAITRDASTDTWSSAGDLSVLLLGILIATPTAGPQRHLIYFDYDVQSGVYYLWELVGDNGNWTQQDHYPLADLGMVNVPMESPSLTPDGLGLVSKSVIAGKFGVYYMSRASLTDRFTPARLISSLPANGIYEPYLTNTCAELYFTAIERILYVTQ